MTDTDPPLCVAHGDPDAHARASRRGGRAGRRAAPVGAGDPVHVGSAADVLDVVSRALQDTHGLDLSVQRQRAIAYLASVALRAVEISELERRVDALERRLPPTGTRTLMGTRRGLA